MSTTQPCVPLEISFTGLWAVSNYTLQTQPQKEYELDIKCGQVYEYEYVAWGYLVEDSVQWWTPQNTAVDLNYGNFYELSEYLFFSKPSATWM